MLCFFGRCGNAPGSAECYFQAPLPARGDHPEREEWFAENTAELRRIAEAPQAVSEAPVWNERQGEWRIKCVGPCPLPNKADGFAQVVLGYAEGRDEAIVVTAIPSRRRAIYKSDGTLRGLREAKK
ncbi:MAG: hypothetical protein IT209_09565 [Armatimonadetes bacterium]|nr:hypothetical protein [Armatimonadota bacterium]